MLTTIDESLLECRNFSVLYPLPSGKGADITDRNVDMTRGQ